MAIHEQNLLACLYLLSADEVVIQIHKLGFNFGGTLSPFFAVIVTLYPLIAMLDLSKDGSDFLLGVLRLGGDDE